MTPPQALFSTLKFKDDLNEKLRLKSKLLTGHHDVVWHWPNSYRTAEKCTMGSRGVCRGIGYKRWGTDIVTCNSCNNTWSKVAKAILADKRKRSIGHNDYNEDNYNLCSIMGAKKVILLNDYTDLTE